ncbi:MAG: serine/threonine-protein kinase [Prochlorothrix sp.]|nr:serine/threonine-protein kinase [Prochlorothrix sp.]
MGVYPDFSAQGFQVIDELGRNPGGGRVTYLAQVFSENAIDIDPNRYSPAVIKQFQFAQGGSWDGYKEIERETQALKDLQHPGIPRYLGGFETENSFCLVQEHKRAQPLSVPRSFSPEQIKQVAVALLEILVYLQERMPPVIHRDIKPENVLVSDNLQVFLIDFGFARIGGNDLAMSSVAAGTFGFMPPEQIRNQTLTTASDLYGLGLTLICVIGNLKSQQVGDYLDYGNQLDQEKIGPKLKGCSQRFVGWLTQMVAPDPRQRFADARSALAALQPFQIVRTPSVELDPPYLEFTAETVGQVLKQTIRVTNPTPETLLEGHWEVAPHPNDPPHTPNHHAWISITPRQVRGNRVDCVVKVDTRQLQTESQGKRQLVFRSNAELVQFNVPLQVKTASNLALIPNSLRLQEIFCSGIMLINGGLLTLGLILAFLAGERAVAVAGVWAVAGAVAMAVAGVWIVVWGGVGIVVGAVVGAVVSTVVGAEAEAWNRAVAQYQAVVGAVAWAWAWAVVWAVAWAVAVAWARAWAEAWAEAVAWAWFVAGAGAVVWAGAGANTVANLKGYYGTLSDKECRDSQTYFWIRYLMALFCGSSIGAVLVLGFTAHLLIPIATLGTGAALLYAHLAPVLSRRRQLVAQRRKEHRLIEP